MTSGASLPPIQPRLECVDTILADWRGPLGNDFEPYRNHVHRVVRFSLALRDCDDEERRKLEIAAAFHDLGIWSARTFDYLPPSVQAASEYLAANGLAGWQEEVALMIDEHHKLRAFKDERYPLVELLRRADLIDVSLGVRLFGLPREHVREVRRAFPNAGFHRRLVRLVFEGVRKRPLNPLPFYKW